MNNELLEYKEGMSLHIQKLNEQHELAISKLNKELAIKTEKIGKLTNDICDLKYQLSALKVVMENLRLFFTDKKTDFAKQIKLIEQEAIKNLNGYQDE